MYEVDDLFDFKRAKDETGRSNKVLHGERYALMFICVCVMIHGYFQKVSRTKFNKRDGANANWRDL